MIDERGGPEQATLSVDGCPVDDLYYDAELRRWGVRDHSYGPGDPSLEGLAWGDPCSEDEPS